MSQQTIILPAIVLIIWTLFMLVWMAATRFPPIIKNRSKFRDFPVGGRGAELNKFLPPHIMWKAHNYDHLLEQPTLFYALTFILVIIEYGSGMNTMLAWGYVGVRIIHSVWQATVNKIIPVRVGLFAISSIILMILAVRTLLAAIDILL